MDSTSATMMRACGLATLVALVGACGEAPSVERNLVAAYHVTPQSLDQVRSGKIQVDTDVLVAQALNENESVMLRARAVLYAVTANPTVEVCAKLAPLKNHATRTLQRSAASAQQHCDRARRAGR